MDYQGQELAEKLANRIILLAALVGLIAGYILQLFKFTLFIIGLGCLIATLVCVPNWGFYNRQQSSYQWLPEDHPAFGQQNEEEASKNKAASVEKTAVAALRKRKTAVKR